MSLKPSCSASCRASTPFFLVIASLFATAAFAQSAANWATYTNVRYSFAVDYPRDVFTAYRESDNSDGATFESKEKGVEFRAFGFLNIDNLSPQATLAERSKDKAPSHKVVMRGHYIVWGIENGAIYYDRCNFKGDRVVCLNLVYPAAQKKMWDATVSRMSRSLRVVLGSR